MPKMTPKWVKFRSGFRKNVALARVLIQATKSVEQKTENGAHFFWPYFSRGFAEIKNVLPMLGGKHIFLCFPCSVGSQISTLATPLERYCSKNRFCSLVPSETLYKKTCFRFLSHVSTLSTWYDFWTVSGIFTRRNMCFLKSLLI